jgi:ankyrin repeat protein
LHVCCRQGRLYDVERWIASGNPLQLAPEAKPKGRKPQTALQIALETGQHSLSILLLANGYRLDLECDSPLDLALTKRRWDLFDLLLEWGADLKGVDPYTVLNTYNTDLYERFQKAGYDLTDGHEMGSIMGHHTSIRPLFGFAKRHRAEDPKMQMELNIALGYHVRAGNQKGISLCLWAGADPHAPAPDPSFQVYVPSDPDDPEDSFVGWSAIEEAARSGNVELLKRLGPDPSRDNFQELFRSAGNGAVIAYLATIQPPKDLTHPLQWHLRWMGEREFRSGGGRGAAEALLTCGVRWEERDTARMKDVRWALLKADDSDLGAILRLLKRPEICAIDTYLELIRTPKMLQRAVALNLVKPRISEHQRRKQEEARRRESSARLARRYERTTLYEQVWARPVQAVAATYGISGVALAKTCRALRVPVPPRGYWARLQHGYKDSRPPLPPLEVG